MARGAVRLVMVRVEVMVLSAGLRLRCGMVGKSMRVTAGDEERRDDQHPFEP